MAHNLGIDVSLPPSEKKSEPIPRVDPSIRGALPARREKIDFIGQIVFKRFCRQLDFYFRRQSFPVRS